MGFIDPLAVSSSQLGTLFMNSDVHTTEPFHSDNTVIVIDWTAGSIIILILTSLLLNIDIRGVLTLTPYQQHVQLGCSRQLVEEDTLIYWIITRGTHFWITHWCIRHSEVTYYSC